MGYDPDNDVALVIWTNLTQSPDGKTAAQALLPTVLDEIYAGLSLVPPPTSNCKPSTAGMNLGRLYVAIS